jgi:hypothetical protein
MIEFEEFCLLKCNAVQSVDGQPTFRRNMSHPSSGLGIRKARNQQSLLPVALLLDLLAAVMRRVEKSSQLGLLERSNLSRD